MVPRPRNLLVLFDENALATQIVVDHLEAFRRHSRHAVFYYSCRRPITAAVDAGAFDAIIVHFSARLPFDGVIHPSVVEAMARSHALKIAMPQDEYDMPFVAARKMRAMGIEVVFTTVPSPYRDRFYPPELIGQVDYVDTLTGYVPEALLSTPRRPHAERRFDMVYRGNELPPWYGELGREKYEIGVRLQTELEAAGFRTDMTSRMGERIYGAAWADFLASGRTMCATESGSNVLDGEGAATRAARKALEDNPGLGWSDLYDRYIRSFDNKVAMNQISPKIFEAIALETGLVLFEGGWSGVLEPNQHYIPLKKDYSNIREVLDRLRDVAAVEGMAKRAYREVGMNPAYRYSALIERLDACIDGRRSIGKAADWTGAMTAVWSEGGLLKLSADAMPLMQPWALPGRASEAQSAAAIERLRQMIEDARRMVPHYRLHSEAAERGLVWLSSVDGAAAARAAFARYRSHCALLAERVETVASELDELLDSLTDRAVRDEDICVFVEDRARQLHDETAALHDDFAKVSELVQVLRRGRPLRTLAGRALGYLHRRLRRTGA